MLGAPFSPPVLSWNALPSSKSVAVMLLGISLPVSPGEFFESLSFLRSSSFSSTTFPSLLSDMPPTCRCDRASPSIRDPIASTAWLATVRPKRVSQALGIGSVLVMVPVAVASERDAPVDGFDSLRVMVSLPSSIPSLSTATEMVFETSPAPIQSVPDFAV